MYHEGDRVRVRFFFGECLTVCGTVREVLSGNEPIIELDGDNGVLRANAFDVSYHVEHLSHSFAV
jgi:hypothetical protein